MSFPIVQMGVKRYTQSLSCSNFPTFRSCYGTHTLSPNAALLGELCWICLILCQHEWLTHTQANTHIDFSSIPTMRKCSAGADSRLQDGSHLLTVVAIPSQYSSHMPTSHLHLDAGPCSYPGTSFPWCCTLNYGSIWVSIDRAVIRQMSTCDNRAPSTAPLALMWWREGSFRLHNPW